MPLKKICYSCFFFLYEIMTTDFDKLLEKVYFSLILISSNSYVYLNLESKSVKLFFLISGCSCLHIQCSCRNYHLCKIDSSTNFLIYLSICVLYPLPSIVYLFSLFLLSFFSILSFPSFLLLYFSFSVPLFASLSPSPLLFLFPFLLLSSSLSFFLTCVYFLSLSHLFLCFFFLTFFLSLLLFLIFLVSLPFSLSFTLSLIFSLSFTLSLIFSLCFSLTFSSLFFTLFSLSFFSF